MYEPQDLSEFIGQKKVVEQIKTVLYAAQKQDWVCPHMLFYGQPGLGKTAIGRLIADEMGTNMIYSVGKSFIPEKELINLYPGDILFIDEVHRLSAAIEEMLYEPLDRFQLSIPTGLYDVPMELEPFTFIGSTTLLGNINKPLRDRCRLNLHFKPYDDRSLCKIVKQAANKTSINIETNAIKDIAKIARGIPRIALQILAMAYDVSLIHGTSLVNESVMLKTKELLEIENDGLRSDDVRYLKTLLESNRPIGQKALAKTLGVDDKSITEVIEPFLIEEGYIILSDNVRILTRKGLTRIAQERR